jgi:hypothetical protein
MLSPSVALLIHHNDLVACRRMAPPEDWRQVPRRPSPVWPSCVAILCGQPMWPTRVARICSGVRMMLEHGVESQPLVGL